MIRVRRAVPVAATVRSSLAMLPRGQTLLAVVFGIACFAMPDKARAALVNCGLDTATAQCEEPSRLETVVVTGKRTGRLHEGSARCVVSAAA